MTEYKVRILALRQGKTAWKEVANTLEDLHEETRRVYQSISFRIRSRAQLEQNLQRIIGRMEQQCGDAINLGHSMADNAEQYLKTEQLVLAQYGIDQPQNKQESNGSSDGIGDALDILIEFLGKFGTIGAAIKLLGDLISGSNNELSLLKDINKIFETGAPAVVKIMDHTADPVAAFLGVAGHEVNGLKEAFASQLEGFYKIGGNTTKSKVISGLGVAAKWVGAALTAVTNLIENENEFGGDWSNPRLYQETITESAIDIGMGIGAGALTALVIGSTGGAAVVGAVVVLAGNELCKFLTSKDGEEGKDIAEWISDAFWDFIGNATGAEEKKISTVWKPAMA